MYDCTGSVICVCVHIQKSTGIAAITYMAIYVRIPEINSHLEFVERTHVCID